MYILGLALHPARPVVDDKRLEEMVFDVTRAALDEAGVERRAVDQVTIAANDELDGRSISSMLLAMPAGAYLKDEIKCTDSGLTGLVLGAMRVLSGFGDLGLVVSWAKNSTSPFEDVMRMRAEPFFLRPIGMNAAIADGLFSAAVAHEMGITSEDAAEAVVAACGRAAHNPRSAGRPLPSIDAVASSDVVAAPLRSGHRAPLTDGAVAMVVASEDWVLRHPDAQPLARLAGFGWCSDSYALNRTRLSSLNAFNKSIGDAVDRAGCGLGDLDAVELDAQTGYHLLAYGRALEAVDPTAIGPSGGAFAQNPYFCTGLVQAAEAVLQVSGRAGGVQAAGAKLALAHGSHGYAQQGNVAAVFEAV